MNTFETKFKPGDRVAWISEDYHRPLRGEVKKVEVVLEPKNRQDETYTIYCDEEIKSSNVHIVDGMELFPESFYSSMTTQLDNIKLYEKSV